LEKSWRFGLEAGEPSVEAIGENNFVVEENPMLSEQCTTRGSWAARLSMLAGVGSVIAILLVARPLEANSVWGVLPGQSGNWSVSTNWGGGLPSAASNVYVNNSGTATITLSGEVCTTLYLGDTSSANSGVIQMTGGGLTVSSAEYIGNSGSGIFVQTGGTNNFSSGQVYLGYGSSGGTYNLGGSGLLYGNNEWIGYSGMGALIQTGGTNNLGAYGWLFMGITGTKGSYNLSASGVLSAVQEYIGDGGAGNFTQMGGANIASSYVYVGYFPSSSGTYSLSNGSFSVLNGYNEYVGFDGTGTFTHSGGTNSCGYLSIGNNSDGSGSYALSGSGLLSVLYSENIGWNGVGGFTQSGGTNTCNGLLLGYSGASGSYRLSNGLLQLAGNMNVGYAGTGAFTQTGGTNNVGGWLYVDYEGSSGTYGLSGGFLQVAGNENVGYGGTGMGTFTQTGGTHTVGQQFYIGYEGNAAYSLSGSGYLSVNATFSSSGATNYGEEYIGSYGTGTFTHSGGTNNSVYLSIGGYAGGSGTYSLSGNGYLSVNQANGNSSEYVGDSGTGLFVQTGGTNSCGYLAVGNGTSGIGTYSLSGSGYLSATSTYSATSYSQENVGVYGLGTFTHSGGTNTCIYLSIGEYAGSSGTYSLTGNGYLSVNRANGRSSENVGDAGTGLFVQTGGTNSCAYLAVGNQSGSIGAYTLSGSGYLSASSTFSATSYSQENVGVYGSGSFTQSGGTNTCIYLSIGELAGSSGTYSLSNGYLSVNQANGHSSEHVGDSGTGIFVQSGGTNSCGTLILGSNSSGSGTYDLNGGLVEISSYLGQGLGTATFNFNGGTLQIDIGATAGSVASATNVPAGALVVNGALTTAALDINNGGSQGTGQLSGSGTITLGLGGLDYNTAASSTFAGTLQSDAGAAILEVDSGVLLLTGTNTLAGTVVTGGTLVVNSFTALAGGSSLTVGQGATSLFAPVLAGPVPAGSTEDVVTVPEPATPILFAAGLTAGFVGWRRRKHPLRRDY
jgi:hypothetical protein